MIKNNKLLSYNRTEIKSDSGTLFIWYEKDCDEELENLAEELDEKVGDIFTNYIIKE